MLIDIIAGARPNFMKIAPVIRALDLNAKKGGKLSYRLVHTGQHYDKRMSGSFFEQLGIPEPHANLEVGSGTQGQQTAAILERYEALILQEAPDLCLVVGDVTSTMACAIAAKKLCIPVAHVEAGIRSGDMTMPEEINRMVTDSISDLFFTTSRSAGAYLQSIGMAEDRVHFVGNTMIDTLLYNFDRLREPAFLAEHRLQPGRYFVLTLHRPANVDNDDKFFELVEAVSAGARGLPVVFPVHPRTAKSLERMKAVPENIIQVDPQPYLEFIWLVKNAMAVITDSGGITEEATVLKVPCLTLRDTTERPETVEIGTNVLVGTDPNALGPVLDQLLDEGWKGSNVPELWDGRSAERIVAVLERMSSK